MTQGFAVKFLDEIRVETVSPTERAAKVNWLVVGCGLIVSNDWPDAAIDDAFMSLAQFATVIPVAITES